MAEGTKQFLKDQVGERAFRRLKSLYLFALSLPHGYNLPRLSVIYKSDKWARHFYAKHYQAHFRKFKFKKIKLLEIGVGGYHHKDLGGNSLRMWKRYFPFGKIFALDIYDKSFVEEHRIRVFQGSQTDKKILDNMMAEIGEPNIIVDDGSHVNTHVISTFCHLFPKLKNGGIYVVEDTQTSYWPDYGGDSLNMQNPATLMNFFKNLTDGINHKEFVNPSYQPNYFDENITSIQFYHNLVFIFKGRNDEPSNVDLNDPESIAADKIYIP